GGGRAGEAPAQEPLVEGLPAGLREGGGGNQAEVAAGGFDALEAVGAGELADLLHVLGRVLLVGQGGGGPVLGVVHDPGVGGGDGMAGDVGGELGVGVVDQDAGGGESVAD